MKRGFGGILLASTGWLILGACVAHDPNSPPSPSKNRTVIDGGSDLSSQTAAEEPELADEELDLLLARGLACINQGEHYQARDCLLRATLIQPDSAKTFDVLLSATNKLIELGVQSELPYEFVEALERLILYQSVEELEGYRQQIESTKAKLRMAQVPVGEERTSSSNLADFELLIAIARDKTAPLDVRKRAISMASVELQDLEMARYLDTERIGVEVHDEESGSLQQRIDEIEILLVEETYLTEVRPDVLAWSKDTADVLAGGDQSKAKDLPDRWDRYAYSIREGTKYVKLIRPYAEAGVEKAKDTDLAWCVDKIDELQRAWSWHYNRWALYIVRQVRSDDESGALARIEILAKVDSGRLNTYVGKQWEDQFQDLYDDCSDTDKDEALRIRILGEYRK